MSSALSSSLSAPEIPLFQLNGRDVQFDPSGALWLPEEKTLVFSDLHFEKGSSYGRKGLFLPPYDTRSTLRRVAEVIGQYQPQTVISLGDTFHDTAAEGRMDEEDASALEALTSRADWVWILGNHDPVPPARFAGEAREMLVLGGLHMTHEPGEHASWNIAGHMHPCARVSRTGRSVRRRCFVTDGERLILPSFGAYTGGLNILDTAYKPFFPSGFSVFMLGRESVWQVPRRALKPDNGTSMIYRK